MTLLNFRDRQIVGLQNCAEVLTNPKLGGVLAKTLVWTVVYVMFHLSIGVLLAATRSVAA